MGLVHRLFAQNPKHDPSLLKNRTDGPPQSSQKEVQMEPVEEIGPVEALELTLATSQAVQNIIGEGE